MWQSDEIPATERAAEVTIPRDEFQLPSVGPSYFWKASFQGPSYLAFFLIEPVLLYSTSSAQHNSLLVFRAPSLGDGMVDDTCSRFVSNVFRFTHNSLCVGRMLFPSTQLAVLAYEYVPYVF